MRRLALAWAPMSATVIRASARVRGSISVSGEGSGDGSGAEGAGDLVVEGSVEGDVEVSGVLTIGRQAQISGAIVAHDVRIAGRLNRSVRATGVVHLTATAEVHGDLEAARVIIDDGAIFEGQVRLRHADATKAASKPRTPAVEPPRAMHAREVPALGVPGRRRAQRRSS